MLFSLKGCGSVDSLFRKKYLILLSLSKFLTGSRSSCDVLLGIKFSPSERTSSWGVFRILEERLVTYFLRLVCLWVSFWICLRVVFLDFLLAYILGYFQMQQSKPICWTNIKTPENETKGTQSI